MAWAHSSLVKVMLGLAGLALFVAAAVYAAIWLNDWRLTMQRDEYVREIIAILDLPPKREFHRRIDKVRMFVNDNSIHEIDAAFWANRSNPAAYAAGVLAYAKGTSASPVHMECSTRTNLMSQVLEALGYETRIVAIYNSRSNLRSHSFLEVKNPNTGLWEAQDPDYDIYWRSKETQERISLADAAERIEAIEPCGRRSCGWDHQSREGTKAKKLASYLDIISITAKQKAERYSVYTSRADLSAIYLKRSKRGSFCEVEAKRCRQGFYDLRKYRADEAGALR